MKPLAESMAAAAESVSGIDTSDTSSLAYASGLFALELTFPEQNSNEIDFSVMVGVDSELTIDTADIAIDKDLLAAINIIATYHFQTIRFNLPLLVH